ncbi:hypothetical protein V8E55_011803 [Tylopilus felleus]
MAPGKPRNARRRHKIQRWICFGSTLDPWVKPTMGTPMGQVFPTHTKTHTHDGGCGFLTRIEERLRTQAKLLSCIIGLTPCTPTALELSSDGILETLANFAHCLMYSKSFESWEGISAAKTCVLAVHGTGGSTFNGKAAASYPSNTSEDLKTKKKQFKEEEKVDAVIKKTQMIEEADKSRVGELDEAEPAKDTWDETLLKLDPEEHERFVRTYYKILQLVLSLKAIINSNDQTKASELVTITSKLDADVEQAQKDLQSGDISMDAENFPALFWSGEHPRDDFDPENILHGVFKGYMLV